MYKYITDFETQTEASNSHIPEAGIRGNNSAQERAQQFQFSVENSN